MRSRYGKVCPTIRSRLFLLLATFSVGLFTVTSAHAATYYVATSGSDSNPGSEAAPFKIVQKAVEVVRAGDTVIIKPGRHAPFDLRNINGADGAPITFFGEPGAVIDRYLGGDIVYRNIELYAGNSYITIDGLELTDSDPTVSLSCAERTARSLPPEPGRNAIKINPNRDGTGRPHHIILKNLNIHGIHTQAILGTADDSQFLNNHIHHNGKYGGDGKAVRQAYGFYLAGRRLLVSGNNMHDNTGHGIRFANPEAEWKMLFDSVIENNIIYNNGGWIEHKPAGRPCELQEGGDGIVIWHGAGNIIRNNIIYGNHMYGIRVNENHTFSDRPNLIYNNTVYKNGFTYTVGGMPGIYTTSGGNRPGRTSIIKNNISYGNAARDQIANTGPGTVLSNNLTTDPQFVNASTGDFGLQTSSPAIDRGVTLAEVPSDFTGKARPVGPDYDIGAFEGAGSKAGALPGVGAGFPGGSPSGPPVLRGPNGEVCPSGYL